MRRRSATVAAALAAGVVVIGCPGPPPARMVPLPPPPAWSESLTAARAERERLFRESPDSPVPEAERDDFDGLEYWPPAPQYYFAGMLEPLPSAEPFTIVTTAGQSRPCERVGRLRFALAGEELTLHVYRLLDSPPGPRDEGLFLPFMDATTGTETYPAGRYVNLDGPPGGPYVLDFNTAYNPSCAYGDPARFACPKAPPENRLAVRVEAGERGWRERGGQG